MTHQTENDPGAMTSSLHAKLQQLADGLTPEEQFQLRSIHAETTADELSPSLRVKLQRSAAAFTPEERAHARRLLQRAAAAAATGDDADTQGYRESLYDGAGELNLWKGPPGANTYNQPNAGGGKIVIAAGSELWNQSGIPQALRALDWYF
jgi:hypothetical protein